MLENIKACFFDMDGTIIDSMWMWRDIDIEFLGRRGIALPEDLQKRIEGMSFTETAFFFKKEFGLEESVDEIKSIWNDMAIHKYRYSVPLKEGVQHFIKSLKECGIKMAIATSNSNELATVCLEALGIKDYFDALVTGCDVGAGKPAPDVYLKCAGICNVKPAECLVFEDIIVGIEAGHNAGMKVCAVYDEYSEDVDDIKRQNADYYIKNFSELKEELQ